MEFDPNGGYGTQQLIEEYQDLIRELEEIVPVLGFASYRLNDPHVTLQPNERKHYEREYAYAEPRHGLLQEQIKAKRQQLEQQLVENRRSFPEVFHHLDRASTRDLEAGLSKYERYREGARRSYYLPPGRPDEEHRQFKEYIRPLQAHDRYLLDVIYELKQELALRERHRVSPPAPTTEEGMRARIEPLLRQGLTIEQVCNQLSQEYPEQDALIDQMRRLLNDELRENL